MARISVLILEEPVTLDPSQISAFIKLLGEAEAQDVLEIALDELSKQLRQAEGLFEAQNQSALHTSIGVIEKIAVQLGMQSVASAAHAVTTNLDGKDVTALSATLHRLLRVGDRSLMDYRQLCKASQ